jgi:hypothetical protein
MNAADSQQSGTEIIEGRMNDMQKVRLSTVKLCTGMGEETDTFLTLELQPMEMSCQFHTPLAVIPHLSRGRVPLWTE